MVWVTPEWLEARIEELKAELKDVEEEITLIKKMINQAEELSRHHRYLEKSTEIPKLRERHEKIKLEIGRAQESLVMLKSNKKIISRVQ